VLSRFGSTLACEDLDGNGRAELFVAAPTQGPWEITPRVDADWYFENQSYWGAVHAFQWNGSTMAPMWRWQSRGALGVCGAALATTKSNVIVGCPYSSKAVQWSGRVVALDQGGAVAWEVHGDRLGGVMGTSLAAMPELNLVAVGSPGHRGGASELMATGAVLLLNASNGAELLRSVSQEAKEQFGRALAAHGSTLWVGVPGSNLSQLLPAAGRVDEMLVQRSTGASQHLMMRQRSLKAAIPGAFSHFGLTLAAIPAGGVAVASPLTTEERGSVHIFSANGVRQGDHNGHGQRSRFGAALAASGTTLLVGAPKESLQTGRGLRHGRVYPIELPVAGVHYI